MSSTNLTDFRDQFAARARQQLQALDLDMADSKALIFHAALFSALDKVLSTPLIGRETLALFAAMSSADIDTWLADPAHRVTWQRLCSDEARIVQSALQDDALRPRLMGSALAWTDILASSAMQGWMAGKAAFLAPYVAANAGCLALTAAHRSSMDKFAAVSAAMALMANHPAWLAAINANAAAQEAIAASVLALREIAKSLPALLALYPHAGIMVALCADMTAATDAWSLVSSEVQAGRTIMAGTLIDNAQVRSALHGNSALVSVLSNSNGAALYQWLFSNRMTVTQASFACNTTPVASGINGKMVLLALAVKGDGVAANTYLYFGGQAREVANLATLPALNTSHKLLGCLSTPTVSMSSSYGNVTMNIGFLMV